MSETLLDRIRDAAPTLDDSDWSDVVARAGLTPPEPEPAPRRRRPRRLVLVAFAAAVLAALAALGPWGGEDDRVTILDRALAAVSGGPVLHAVLRIDAGQLVIAGDGGPTRYTVVDLGSGHERAVETQIETWYDPDRDVLHQQVSTDGVVQWDSLRSGAGTGASPIDPALAAFFKGYRRSLDDGSARPVSEETIDGRRVIWLRFEVSRRGAQEIAVDTDSYQGLFLRGVCPECSAPPPTYKIVTLEGVAVEAANFTSPVPRPTRAKGRYSSGWRRTIELSEATSRLGRTALWAGPAVEGIALSRVQYIRASRHTGLPTTRRNQVARGRGLMFRYGDGAASVSIVETASYRFGPGNFDSRQAGRPLALSGAPIPPEGQAALTSIGPDYGWIAQLRKDGLFLEISSRSREVALAAARALQPVPR
jgi:hypothetical protein